MHISFTAHDPSKSTSSFGLIDYLDKENQDRGTIEGDGDKGEKKELDKKQGLKSFFEDNGPNGLLDYLEKEDEKGGHDKSQLDNDDKFEAFFDGGYSETNTDQKIDIDKVVNSIDSNRGTQNLKQANFYMMNISPKKTELLHMENLADEELKKRGLMTDSKNELLQKVHGEQKSELMKIQLKLYAKEIMDAYADNFNREIYVDESMLPNKEEKKSLLDDTEKEFNEYLKGKGIEIEQVTAAKKSNKWIETDTLTVLDEKGNSYLAELDLGDGRKSEVYVPKKMMKEQENGSYKLPEDLYKEKEREALEKLVPVVVGAKHTGTKVLKNKETVHNFENRDPRFKEPLKMSFKESDLTKKGRNYFVSRHLLNQKQKAALKSAVLLEHGEEKYKIYENLAKEKGFNLEKRKLTADDLLWYGKVETQRTHKPTDKHVMRNKETLKEIKDLGKGKIQKIFNKGKIQHLESKLIRDGNKNVIREGMKKEGPQYHLHLVVSRHDKTMKKAENKISLSPLANHKQGKMHKGADVGFDRDKFFQKSEEIFDEKFGYDRDKEETYESHKQAKKQRSMTGAKIRSKAKGEVKGFLMEKTGASQIKQHISPIQNIKKQLGVAKIPTRIPKTPLELAYKVGKKIIEKGFGY